MAPCSTILPWCITMMRSASESTTARSWLMNRHAKPRSLCRSAQQLEHASPAPRRRARDGRLVGDQQLRLRARGRGRCRRAASGHPTARAGSGCGTPAAARPRRGAPPPARRGLRPWPRPRAACGSPMDCADRQPRVQRRRRVLEHDADVLVHLVQQAAIGLRDVVADDVARAVRDRQEADRGAPDGRLARARLADEARRPRRGRSRASRRSTARNAGTRPRLRVVDRDVLELTARGRSASRRSASSRAATSARRSSVVVAGQRGGRVDRLVADLADARHGGQQLPGCTGAAGRRRRPRPVPRSTISPLRITTMSSARSATTPMSCVMSRIAESRRCAEVAHEVEDLGLHRDVERRGRLVGDQQPRVARDRLGDHRALTLAAGELVRVRVERLQRVGQLDQVEQLERARLRRARRDAEVDAQRLDDLRARRCSTGFSAVIGSWKIDRDLAAAHAAQLVLRQAE